MDKMNIDIAKRIVDRNFIPEYSSHWRAKGFIEGFKSRNKEINELNKQIEDLACQLRVKLAEDVLGEESKNDN